MGRDRSPPAHPREPCQSPRSGMEQEQHSPQTHSRTTHDCQVASGSHVHVFSGPLFACHEVTRTTRTDHQSPREIFGSAGFMLRGLVGRV